MRITEKVDPARAQSGAANYWYDLGSESHYCYKTPDGAWWYRNTGELDEKFLKRHVGGGWYVWGRNEEGIELELDGPFPSRLVARAVVKLLASN